MVIPHWYSTMINWRGPASYQRRNTVAMQSNRWSKGHDGRPKANSRDQRHTDRRAVRTQGPRAQPTVTADAELGDIPLSGLDFPFHHKQN